MARKIQYQIVEYGPRDYGNMGITILDSEMTCATK